MPEEDRFDTEINGVRFKVIIKSPWIKAVPILAKVPAEGVHIVTQSGTLWPESHLEFYSNGQSTDVFYPGNVVGGSVVATPAGAYTDLSSGDNVWFVPMDSKVTQLTISAASGSVCLSSSVSGYVAYVKYPQTDDI